MENNASAFPDPPYYYKKRLNPPKPPQDGEFSMFGRTYTTKETPLRIDTQNFVPLVSDSDLQDPLFFQRDLLYKFQNSLLHAGIEIIKGLAENPAQSLKKFEDYERIMVNFYQLIYWMRPLQALETIKNRISSQIESKEKLRNELLVLLQDLKFSLTEIISE